MITKLKIKELSKYVQWCDLEKALMYHYPAERGKEHILNTFKQIFEKIQNCDYCKVAPNEFVYITGGVDIKSDFFLNYGKKFLNDLKSGDDFQDYRCTIIKENGLEFSMSFIQWKYLMNLPVHYETLKFFTFVDIIAHFIWEISFYGNEKKSIELGKKLNTIVKDIKKNKN